VHSKRNGSAPTDVGFRRIEVVQIIVEDAGPRAEVTGVVHRLPHTVRVPLHTARALIANGAPSRIVDVRS
jgi:hypothetical protein